MATILVIEDDAPFRAFVEDSLWNLGYQVISAGEAKTGIEKAVLHKPDAILLDLKLPGMDGKEAFLFLKNNPHTGQIPVIILTGEQDILDEVEGLSIGAEDYISKPFEFGVLKARLEKALKRPREEAKTEAGVEENGDREILTVGRVTLDLRRQSVSVDGQDITLTPTEFKILTLFMRNTGRVVPRRSIAGEVWKTKNGEMEHLVDAHITNIRKKLGSFKHYLQARYRTGYCFQEAD